MVGYRKLVGLLITLLAEIAVVFFHINIPEEMQTGLVSLVLMILEIAIPASYGLFVKGNIDAKKVMMNGGVVPAKSSAGFRDLGDTQKLGVVFSPEMPETLNMDFLLAQAQISRETKFKNYKLDSVGSYFGYQDAGKAIETNDIFSVVRFCDTLWEMAQQAWYDQTVAVVKDGFSWKDRGDTENLAKGYSIGCHAMTPESWARHFALETLYRQILSDELAISWVYALADEFPDVDLFARFQKYPSLTEVEKIARHLYQYLESQRKPPFKGKKRKASKA